MLSVGIDVGSRTSKVALLEEGKILQLCLADSSVETERMAQRLLKKSLRTAGRKEDKLLRVASTGYGRNAVSVAHSRLSEITCHAMSIHHFLPQARTIIDIGGQDCKGIKINGRGRILDFVMNEKCAAGTGRFLEVMAKALKVPLQDMGPLSSQATENTKVSSTCTVFAESQVITNIAQGASKPDLIAGILSAISERIVGMLSRLEIEPPVALTGGGALNSGLIRALEEKLKETILIPPHPQFCGAIGAALILARQVTVDSEQISQSEGMKAFDDGAPS